MICTSGCKWFSQSSRWNDYMRLQGWYRGRAKVCDLQTFVYRRRKNGKHQSGIFPWKGSIASVSLVDLFRDIVSDWYNICNPLESMQESSTDWIYTCFKVFLPKVALEFHFCRYSHLRAVIAILHPYDNVSIRRRYFLLPVWIARRIDKFKPASAKDQKFKAVAAQSTRRNPPNASGAFQCYRPKIRFSMGNEKWKMKMFRLSCAKIK